MAHTRLTYFSFLFVFFALLILSLYPAPSPGLFLFRSLSLSASLLHLLISPYSPTSVPSSLPFLTSIFYFNFELPMLFCSHNNGGFTVIPLLHHLICATMAPSITASSPQYFSSLFPIYFLEVFFNITFLRRTDSSLQHFIGQGHAGGSYRGREEGSWGGL